MTTRNRRSASARRLLVALAILAAAGIARAQPGPEDAAQRSGEAWLSMVDAGRYAESWDEAARYFKGSMSRDGWKDALTGVRSPLGKVLSRRLRSGQYAETLPGAPDGKYVVLQYDTSFFVR